jgi:MoaA/NifB/PqqE/SkfB family radical SAM enzyme
MIQGEDWFNSKELKERRDNHLTGIKHPDCNYCWQLEDNKLPSHRTASVYVKPTDNLVINSYTRSSIEIKVSNICNMACRYCGPNSSSIWAERLNQSYTKISINKLKKAPNRKLILDQMYEWLNNEIKYCKNIVITGGEPTISPQFYELVDKINFNNSIITINSNLNMPETYIT